MANKKLLLNPKGAFVTPEAEKNLNNNNEG